MIELSPAAWIAFTAGGLLTGFIDSIAGGGGLISLPVLLAAGLPPHLAIGTNKVQSVFGSGTAAWRYGRKGLIPWKKIWPGVVMSLGTSAAGSWAGSQLVMKHPPRFIRPFFLAVVAATIVKLFIDQWF